MTLEIRVYDGIKYDENAKEVARVTQEWVDNIWVGAIDDNRIYELGYDEVDEYGEYAILKFMNGEMATYRNSHIDIFRVDR